MRVICAWCQYVIREDDFSGLRDSHGICEKCQNIYYPKKGRPKRVRTAKTVISTPTHLDLNLLSARESGGPFCHWPKADWRYGAGRSMLIDTLGETGQISASADD